MSPLRVVSLGAGVQSSALTLMGADGVFGSLPDMAVFADTGWEPSWVYEQVEYLRSQLAGRVELVVVSRGSSLRDDALATVEGSAERFASMPLFTRGPATGKVSMLRRQSTREYKIAEVNREIRRRLGSERPPEGVAEVWLGISVDEVSRMKPDPAPGGRPVLPAP